MKADSAGVARLLGGNVSESGTVQLLSEKLTGVCNCQSTVLLRRSTAIQCPQADFFWRSTYKWEVGGVQVV